MKRKEEVKENKVFTAQEKGKERFQLQRNYDVAKEAYRVDKNEVTRKALLKAHKELKG